MPNYCSFTLTVTGPDEDLSSFKVEVESHMEKVEQRHGVCHKGEFILDLNYWGGVKQAFCRAFPGYEEGEPGRAVESPGSPINLHPGKATICGETTWLPPIEFIHFASKKYPSLCFECQSWIESGEFEHWTGSGGHMVEVEYQLRSDMTSEMLKWRKHGVEMSQATVAAFNEEHLLGDRWESDRFRTEAFPLEEQVQHSFDTGVFGWDRA